MAALALVSLVGTAVSAMGTIAAGNAQQQAAQAQAQMNQFKAKQHDAAAAESRAAAQREALEHRKAGELAQSQLQARAAADGGTATDVTPLNLGGGIASKASYGALMANYKGENRARGLEDQATLDRMAAAAALAEGEAKQTASMFSAAGTVISGLGSAYSLYKKDYG
jgi:hypothetical protein